MQVKEVVAKAYASPFTLQSNYARHQASAIATACCLGFITTRLSPHGHHFGDLWRPTAAGLLLLENIE